MVPPACQASGIFNLASPSPLYFLPRHVFDERPEMCLAPTRPMIIMDFLDADLRKKSLRLPLLQKNDLGRRRPCGRRNFGALSCTWKGAAECFLVASDPVKKHGPWAVAGLKVATPFGDPVLGN